MSSLRFRGSANANKGSVWIALQNPRFTQAIDEMQRDPKAAMLKYQKDEAVSTMLRDFMEFLGGHFEEVRAGMALA